MIARDRSLPAIENYCHRSKWRVRVEVSKEVARSVWPRSSIGGSSSSGCEMVTDSGRMRTDGRASRGNWLRATRRILRVVFAAESATAAARRPPLVAIGTVTTDGQAIYCRRVGWREAGVSSWSSGITEHLPPSLPASGQLPLAEKITAADNFLLIYIIVCPNSYLFYVSFYLVTSCVQLTLKNKRICLMSWHLPRGEG